MKLVATVAEQRARVPAKNMTTKTYVLLRSVTFLIYYLAVFIGVAMI
jgi:hypothetical protein